MGERETNGAYKQEDAQQIVSWESRRWHLTLFVDAVLPRTLTCVRACVRACSTKGELKSARLASREDARVHACVYMVSPTGREVKEADALMMKSIQGRVNLIPVRIIASRV